MSVALHCLIAELLKLNLVFVGSVIVSVLSPCGWRRPGSLDWRLAFRPVGLSALVAVRVILDVWVNWELAYASPAALSITTASAMAAMNLTALTGSSPC